MASHHVPLAVVLELGRNFLADIHAMIATRMEFTA